MKARNKAHINYDIIWLGAFRAISSNSLRSINANLKTLESHFEEDGYKEDVDNYKKNFEEEKAPLEEDSPFLLDKRECKTGDTLLIRAASLNQFDIAKRLVNAGALVHIKNNQNQTALFYALQNQNIEMAKFLLSHGATFAGIPLNVLYDLLSKINIHAMRDWLNLLNKQVDITKIREKGHNFMDYVATHIFNMLKSSGKRDFKKDFLDLLLMLKEKNPDLDIANCRIIKGEDPYEKSAAKDGATPLMVAVLINDLNKVLKLLEFNNPDSINLKDDYGHVALEYALEVEYINGLSYKCGNIEIVHALLSYGANLEHTHGENMYIYHKDEIYCLSKSKLQQGNLSEKYAAFSCLNILELELLDEQNSEYRKLLEKHEQFIESEISQERIGLTDLPKRLVRDYLLFNSKPLREHKQEEEPSSQVSGSHPPKKQ